MATWRRLAYADEVPYVGTSAPSTPPDGKLWWDTDDAGSIPISLHEAVTVSAPIAITAQVIRLINDATATVTEIDTGALANSDTVIPTSKAVTSALAAISPVVWSLITSDPSPAIKNKGYLCNTTAAAFTVTLPAAPSAGDVIVFADAASTFHTNNLTIGRAALKIMGLDEDLVVNIKDSSFSLVYASAALGWRIAT